MRLGDTGNPGHLGAGGGAGGGPQLGGNPIGSGGKGAIQQGCGMHGHDGRLELLVETPGTGQTCPVGRVASCTGTCAPAAHLGDGVCDAQLACPEANRDDGDCPEDAFVSAPSRGCIP